MKKLFFGLGLLAVVAISCAKTEAPSSEVISKGKKVTIDYTLSANGHVVETTIGKTSLEYVQGDNEYVLPGLAENELDGLKVGDEKTIVAPAEKAYGKINPKGFVAVPLTDLPEGMEAKGGMMVNLKAADGKDRPAVVWDVQPDKVILNFNHPLAGQELTYAVKVLAVTE